MSNLLKLKSLVGFAVLAVMFLGVFAFTNTASAASAAPDCTFTSFLKQGMSNSAVNCLQTRLNNAGFNVSLTGAGSPGSESSYFGSKTRSAVLSFQSSNSLVADGLVGTNTRAALFGAPASGGTTLPAGCTSTSGFSPLTGVSCATGVSSTPTTGPVSAAVSITTPAAGTLVAGQATADLAHFTFSGTGTVTSVVLKRLGVSADTTPSNVYLFDGVTRLTDAASVSSTGLVTFNMPSGIFSVAGTKTISVKSDIAASTSGQTLGMMLTSFTTASGVVNTTLSGNIHTIASATLATVAAGTVTPSGATLNPGAGVTLWQSSLTVSNRDVWMKRISFRNLGSAQASAFANFKLFVNGVQVATATTLDANGYVTFDMTGAPITIATGTRIMRVDADIVSGASRTVQLSLRNAADVDFVDSSFGVNVSASSTPWTSSSANTISGTSGGSITIEKDSSSASGNVSEGTNDSIIGVFKVTAFGEPMKIETIRATYTSSDASIGSLRNGRIMIGGVQYGSTSTLNEDSQATPYTSYTLNFTVYPGTPVLMELRADLYDNDGTDSIDAADTIIGTIAAGSSNVQKVDSLGSVTAPASAVAANTLTFASPAATLTKDATYANQTVVLPSTAFKIGDWNLAGSSVEDILLTTLSFDVDEVSGSEFDQGELTNMYVVVKSGATIVAQPSPLSTASATDNNFSINYTLVKNGSLSIELYANMSDDGLIEPAGASDAVDSGDSFKTDLTVTGTALTSGTGVTATSADTDGQTIAAGTASITATTDASAPVAAIVHDNQTVTASVFKFAALTASYNITDITFTLANATVAQTVELYDGATLVASRPGAATVTFNGLLWNVPSNTNKYLTVKLVLGGIGIGAGTTGSSQLLTMTAFSATNLSTGVNATGTESDPAGNAMYAYASIPTITNVALPTTTLGTGTQTVAKFSITSNGGTIGWKYLAFVIAKNISGTDTLASATVWDADTNTQITGTPTFTGSVETDNDTAGGLTFVATNEQQINGTKTYIVKMTIAGTLASGDNLSVNIDQPLTAYDAPDAYADVLTDDATATFVWTDQSASAHDATTDDWNHGYLVKNLPTDTQTMTY